MKICNRCGGRVEDSSNFCPYCKSTVFRPAGEVAPVTTAGSGNLAHKLLYWKYPNGYMISKTKFAAVSVFLIFCTAVAFSTSAPAMILLGLIFAAFTFVVGFAFHNIASARIKPKAQMEYNDYGLVVDLKHFLFYWQNSKTGAYAISKTKLISLSVFIGCFIFFYCIYPVLFSAIIFALLVEAPVFLVGYGIHKITNPNPVGEIIPKQVPAQKPKVQVETKPKPEIPKPKVEVITPQKYGGYKAEVENLKAEFDRKDAHVRDLIAKRFEPPQLTYTRFISIVDKSRDLFSREYESILNLINLGDENSPRIEGEIQSRIGVLKSIIEKTDDLTNELVVSMDSANDEEVTNLAGEMEDLIKSVREYK